MEQSLLNKIRIERPRPSYKPKAHFWRTFSIGLAGLCLLMALLLAWSIRGNIQLQKELTAHMGITAILK